MYGNHMVTLSRKQLKVGYYLDQPLNNIYIVVSSGSWPTDHELYPPV